MQPDHQLKSMPAAPAAVGAMSSGDPHWEWRQSSFDAARRAHDESIYALANGSLGIRGGFEEERSATDGCFLSGFYETHPIGYHERFPGFASNTDTRIPAPECKRIRILLDGNALDLDACEWREFERTMDLRNGLLRRRVSVQTPQGAALAIDSERFVSYDTDLVAIRYRITSLNFDGILELASSIEPGRSAVAQGADPRIGAPGTRTLELLHASANADRTSLTQRTANNRRWVTCEQRHHPHGLEFLEARATPEAVTQVYRARMQPNLTVTLEKYAAYASGTDAAFEAAPILSEDLSYESLRDAHCTHVREFWKNASVDVEGDSRCEAALRFNLFHLWQSAGRNAESATAAKGLTGEGYEGHCFWDSEVFVLPVMAFTAPEIARAMLEYRYRTLDAARRHAREMKHPDGALYPWRTIGGNECSSHYPSGSAAYHINADIAYAIGLYLDVTCDTGFFLSAGAEMLFETARIWPQVGHFDHLRNDQFGIYGVTGPDEYSLLVDNNFYTNRMAQRHLQRAVKAWEELAAAHPHELSALAGRIGLDEAEVALWRRAAERMQLNVDPVLGIFAQDDGFLHKPYWPGKPSADGKRALLLDNHPLTLSRHQVCKQADLVMALALAGDGLDEKIVRRSFDHYEAVTTHDSTLSPSVHGVVAARLGLISQAKRFFDETLYIDIDDLHGNTDHGVHMAALAGSWLGLACWFGGLRIVDGRLTLRPRLPEAWHAYAFQLHWQGRQLEVRVARSGSTYLLRRGDPLHIVHDGRSLQIDPGTPLDVVSTE